MRLNIMNLLDRRLARRRLALSRLVLLFSIAALTGTAVYAEQLLTDPAGDISGWELALFYGPVLLLMLANVAYMISRTAFFKAQLATKDPTRDELEELYDRQARSMTVLVPSYKEEESVIAHTLLSAALMEYPRKSVVLLLDDPVKSPRSEDRARAAAAQRVVSSLNDRLSSRARVLRSEADGFRQRLSGGRINEAFETGKLCGIFFQVADWLDADAAALLREGPDDRTAAFMARSIVGEAAKAHRDMALGLRSRSLTRDELARQYERVGTLFDSSVTCFARKRYANLSHQANKAMNLNAYLSLMGRCFRETQGEGGLVIEECDAGSATLTVPATDYVMILDADSMIVPDYALRLVRELEKPGNERVALIQTPYSALPQATGALERVAGATTDLHFFVHEGMSHCGAAFWVGPNSIVRREALEDVAKLRDENGLSVKVYIDDRTVIEDTETTVTLVSKGWSLSSYMGRLAYSATPADFGALAIQRERWANGGLLILGHLLRTLVRRPLRAGGLLEAFLRLNSLTGAAVAGFAMAVLVLCNFDDRMVTVWLPLLAVPYYCLLVADLRMCGYRASDLQDVYALNMLLIPILVGGTLLSLAQGLTGRKAVFKRTPKVADRTSMPLRYLLACYALFGFAFYWMVENLATDHHFHAFISTVVAASLFHGLTKLVPIKAQLEDIRHGIVGIGTALARTPAAAAAEA